MRYINKVRTHWEHPTPGWAWKMNQLQWVAQSRWSWSYPPWRRWSRKERKIWIHRYVLFSMSFPPKHSVWQSHHLPNKEWASSPPLWHTEKLWAWQNQCYQRRWYHNWAPPISPGKLKHWLRKCRLPRVLWVDRLNDKARASFLPWRFVLFKKKIKLWIRNSYTYYIQLTFKFQNFVGLASLCHPRSTKVSSQLMKFEFTKNIVV